MIFQRAMLSRLCLETVIMKNLRRLTSIMSSQRIMSNSKATLVQENEETRRKLSNGSLNEVEFVAAEVLYELANNKKAAKKLRKRKLNEDCSSNRSQYLVDEHNIHEYDNDRSSCNNEYVAHKSVNSNRRLADSEKLIIGAPSSNKSSTQCHEFSFSVIHLLSAVRAALVTPISTEHTFASPKLYCSEPSLGKICTKECYKKNLPSLTIHQVTHLAKCMPGDSRILECTEPLIELVKGALNIFASETAPFGEIEWKSLSIYNRLSKTWLWTGPLACGSTHDNGYKVETSCKSWRLSHEILVELVSKYAVWLRKEQPILQRMAGLPKSPLEATNGNSFRANFNNRKRSKPVITQSSGEVRLYFQREEAIRYTIPERPFQYTALDGMKSTVAPLRRSSSKALTKARGHYIFKPNRPPQFSLLSLVRDAASRLPSGMGTRADICILIRDSQYIVEDVEEKAVKQAVGGALDRLQSEHDPSIEYNGKWGLWVYLHKDREPEDFVGTGSTINKRAS